MAHLNVPELIKEAMMTKPKPQRGVEDQGQEQSIDQLKAQIREHLIGQEQVQVPLALAICSPVFWMKFWFEPGFRETVERECFADFVFGTPFSTQVAI